MGGVSFSVQMVCERLGEGDMDGAASIFHHSVVTLGPGD